MIFTIKMRFYETTCNLRIVLIIWSQLILHLSADNQRDALVFDRHSSSLLEISPSISPESPCGGWAAACPAQSEADDKFIEEIALTENALFVQNKCPKEKTLDQANFKTDICERSFRMSVLFNKKNFAFEFGYEIYFGEDDTAFFETTHKAKRYVSAEILFESIRKKNIKILTKLIFEEVMRLILREQKDLWHNKNKKLRFIWISLFKIKFDFIKWTPKRIIYQIRSNNKWPAAWSCRRYNLDSEAYQDLDLDHLYSLENQKNIFSNLQSPDETSEAACKRKCLGKWLLIPIDQFHFGSLNYPVCANMATVPIWISTIRDAMKTLEKYLHALYKVNSIGLYIISGKSGQLQLTKIKKKKFEKSKTPVFLDEVNQKIPVPKILYKIIKYKPDNCPNYEPCWYSATIVIHNDPNFNPDKDKICEDVTESWGWTEAITQSVPTSDGTPLKTLTRYIYVCQSDSKLLKKLMGFSARGEPREMEDLNLHEFPMYEKSTPNENPHESPTYKLVQKSIIRQINYQLLELAKLKREMIRTRFTLGLSSIPSRKKPLEPMDGISEAEENGTDEDNDSQTDIDDIEELPQNDDIIERPVGDDEGGDVVVEPTLAKLGEEFHDTTTDEDDDDMGSDEAQPPSEGSARKRILHTTPEHELDQKLISDEDEDDEIPDSEMIENSFHEDAEVGSEDESEPPQKKNKKASTSSDLEEQSYPEKSHSVRDEEISSEHDLKDEEKSSPRVSTGVNISPHLEYEEISSGHDLKDEEKSSPRESTGGANISPHLEHEEMSSGHDLKNEEKSSPRESTGVNISPHLEQKSSPDREK